MKYKFTLLLFLGLFTSARVWSQMTLQAAPLPNNGSGGIFLALTTNTSPVYITAFNTYFAGAVGTPRSIEIYTMTGNYTGFTGSSTGWTLVGSATATGAGTTTIAPIDVTALNIQVPAGTTQSFYLHSVTTSGGLRYNGTGTAPPVTTYSDANLQLFSDVSRTGTVAFAGNQNSPRTFAGSVEYSLTPLALKWLSVSAKSHQGTALVSWDVEEKEVSHYNLERHTENGYVIGLTPFFSH